MAKRYKHNVGNYHLLTGDMGKLYPIGLKEVIRNDSIRHSTNVLIRLSPMASPVYHNITVRVHHFFVPHRLTWGWLNDDCGKSWENFITGGPDGNDTQTVPTLTTTGEAKDLLDYFGVPTVAGIEVSAVPIAAFNLIYNEFYRDQDLAAERLDKDLTVPHCAWEKDYFTAARPWAQKGPEITLPLTGDAPVSGLGWEGTSAPNTNVQVNESDGSSPTYAAGRNTAITTNGQRVILEQDPNNAGFPNVKADLSQVSAASVNDVRRAFALQRMQEARSRFGSRYTEFLRYYGVRNPRDSRLQRPEYLGGGRVRVGVSEVLQTAPEGTDPRFGVGDLYGHGIAAVRSNAYRRYFEEDGYIISVLSVRPKAVYQNGIERTWLRRDKEDFYQKELEFIGQQAVYNNEVYADATDGMNTFGYSDRYREYRECKSQVTSEFRNTLNYWHLARDFGQTAPVLNEEFIKCTPSKRIFNVQTEDVLWCYVQHRAVMRRLLAKSAYGKII